MQMLVNQMDAIFKFLFDKQLREEHKNARLAEPCDYPHVSQT